MSVLQTPPPAPPACRSREALGPPREGTFRSVFLSDLHLGSPRCQARALLDFLARTQADFLYLVGDVVDHWSEDGTRSWPAPHERVLQAVAAKAAQGTRVTYLRGNHDGGFSAAWRRLHPQLPCVRELEHRSADGRRFMVLHGDRFDGWIGKRRRWLGLLGDGAAAALECAARRLTRLLPRSRRGVFAPWVMRSCKRAIGYTGRFERSAARWARERQADGVICGHIHQPAAREIEGVLYLNDGDWVQSCTALVEHADGRFEILHARPAA